MKIRYTIPNSPTKNLSEAYNYEISLGGSEYVAFCDRDTMFLDPFYAQKIEAIVTQHPGNYYTCSTNRTNCQWQKYQNPNTFKSDDIKKHIKTAAFIWNRFSNAVQDHTHSQLWSGHLMICPVAKWKPLTTKGLLGVDNEIHKNAIEQGAKVLLMKGVYVYHWYSGYDGDRGHLERDKSHLK